MEETKERLKNLIDFFTGQYLQSLSNHVVESSPTTSANPFEPDSIIKTYIDDVASNENNEPQTPPSRSSPLPTSQTTKGRMDPITLISPPISKQDLESILRTLELCKTNLTHFSNNERSYLMPLMTLSGHVLLTKTHLISRSNLSTVSDVLVYILQFLIAEISNYNEDDSNYANFDPAFLKQMNNSQLFSYNSEEYYRYFVKYRLIKFLSFMLLDDDKSFIECSLQQQDLIALCQMLRMKPLPDTLRLHSANFETDSSLQSAADAAAKTNTLSSSNSAALSNPTTISSSQYSVKRMRLTKPGQLERNSKERFFDQLLTPFIYSPTTSTLNPFSSAPVSAAAANSNSANISSPPLPSLSSFLADRVQPDPNAPLRKMQNSPILSPFFAAADIGPPSMAMSPNSAKIATTGFINAATQSTQQIRSHLISQNQLCFQYIGGATSILNLIDNFTLLRPYSLHLLAIEEGVPLRLLRMDGQDFVLICDRLATDIDLVQSVFALNRLLEPLTCDRISKMIVIVQSCLLACLSLIQHVNQLSRTLDTTATIETLTPTEALIMDMIENSLALYNKVFDMFRQSNRVGGQINQNAHMFTTWLLFTGLQMILNAEPTTAQQPPGQSSTAASSNIVKRPQGYSALCIPLAKHALQLMSKLLDDLHLEFGDRNIILDEADVEDVVGDGANIKELNFINRFSFNFPASQKPSSSGGAAMPMASTTATSGSNAQQPMAGGSSNAANLRSSGNNQSTFKYNKFGHYSAWQRIDMIVSSNLNVIQLLFSYMSAGYRRATLLRHSVCKTSSFVVEDEKMDSSTVEGSSDKPGKEKEKDDLSKMIEKFVEFHRNFDLKQSLKTHLNSDTDNDEDDDNDFEDVNMHRSLKYETPSKLHHFTQRKKDGSKQKQRSQKSKTPPAKPRDGDDPEKKKEALNRQESKAKLEKEIDSHYELVISILDHLNFSYVCSKIDALRSYFKQMLTDAQLIVLSHIIQDLDSEMDNVQVLTPLSSKTFNMFSNSLTSFMHNLIAMQLLTEEQQNSLLAYLGFKPSLESECSWPLHHGVRSLAILAQIILLRQHKEQEDIKLDLNSTTIQIWRGFINKLKQAALSFNGEMAAFNAECPDYQEDLNVEHAQLMLFLFHNLKLLQRKHVFSLLFTAINEISQKFYQKKCLLSAAQILFVGRILHIFEYMCKNLYDTPSYLFDQVNHNLLNLNQNQDPSCPPQSREEFIKTELDDLEKYPDSYRNIKYFADIKLEENYFNYYMSRYKMSTRKQKNLKTPINMAESTTNFFDFIIHPRFYHLMEVNLPLPKSSSLRNFKPKLDGIACNFMLAGLSSLSYDQFYDSLLNLFQFIGYQYDSKLDTKTQEEHCDKNLSNETIGYPHFGIFGLCSIDYTFGTMWRLLNQLPPSLQFLNEIVHTVDKFIANDKSFLTIDASRILNMCIWMPRFESNRPVCTWVSDLISKTANSANDMNELYQSLNNKNNANVAASNRVTITPADIESLINDLSKRLGSLEFNYHLLKLLSWPFFRYSPPPPMSNISFNNLPSNIKHRLITQQQQLLPLQYYTFPKFFTLFTMDIYLERFVSLFQNQFKPTKISKKTYEISKLFDSQELIERILNLLLGVFEKIYNDLAAVLIYDSPLSQAGRDDESDMKYLLHRSMVNICTTNSFEINTSDLALNLMDYLPQAIVARMDTWNRIHVNVERNISDVETPGLFQKGILFDVPLIELPAHCFGSSTVTSGNTNAVSSASNDKQISMNIFNFSGFIIEKYAILDIPEVVSVDAGYANISWIKMKQFMVKLFKFIEIVYSRKSAPLPDDQLIACWLFDLNFISKALAIKIGENQNSHLYKILNQMFDLKNDFYYNETFCSILYPYFIGNGYFLMTVYNHPLFSRLKDYDSQRFQKIFEFASIEFCKLFSKIITRTSGMLAFEEFLCEDSPLTPTNQSIMAGNQLQPSSLQSNYSLLSLIEVCQHPLTKPEYSVHIMKFFKILLSQSWKNPDDISLIRLCSELSSALRENPDRTKLLSEWFERVLMHRTTPTSEELAFGDIQITSRQEQRYYIDDDSNANLYLFFKFITYAIKGTSRFDEVVLSSMADALIENMEKLLKVVCIQTDNQFLYFAGLFTTLVHLISAIGQNDVKQPSSQPSNQKPLGHFKLIPVVISWLSYCKNYFQKQEKLGGKAIETSLVQGKKRFLLEASFQMLSYLSDIFNAMEYKFVHLRSRPEDVGTKKEEKDPTKNKESIKTPSRIFLDDNYDCEDDCTIHVSDDENDEEDDEELAQLLCTFTQTQKDFINQHWYHCHTCKMLDGKGVCTVCAKVCHRGHDVTYSKYGSFFCDCGASEDNSCKALVKRQVVAKNNGNKTQNKKRTSNQKSNGNSTNNASGKDANSQKTIFNKKRSMRISKYWYTAFYAMDQYFSKLADNYKQSKSKFSNQMILQNYEHFGLKYEHLETFAHQLQSYVSPLSENILSLMEFFMPILEKFFRTNSELGYLTRIRKEFQLLQTRRTPLLIEKSEQLMLPIKCWPDTVFENVNISEEQSPSSRHLALVNNAIVLRKLMVVLGANSNLTYGGQTSNLQPCFLVIAHDMNRLSIVQLNHLLGQAYQTAQQQQQSSSSCPPKKKLSPQKIATVSFPFPIMYIAKNPLNEELLAVCGIKECHILSLARNGAITGHRELSLQGLHGFLKPFWFPDSQTELALITAEFIKIYDLGKDGSDQDTPLYNFSIPCRKMRDMTFFSCEENGQTRRFLLIFSCLGPIYVQELCPESRCSTANDVFYVTTILKLSAPEECDLPSLFKGFSIHYSYLLQMLFIAYLDGTSFCCPFNIENIHRQQIDNLTILDQYSNQIPTPANSQGQQYNTADASSSSSATTSSAAATAAAAGAASTTASANNSKAELPRWCQLFQWTEVPHHPGLVFALTFDTFTPACFMVQSGSIKVQELKPKKKVLDFIVVSTAPMSTDISNNNGLMQPMEMGSCSNAKNSKVTTLVCLCEDGSLRFYRANNDETNFWLKPSSFDLDRIPTYSGVTKNCKSGSNTSSETLIGRFLEQATESLQFLDDSNVTPTNNRNPKFPVDFFEHCSLMNDIEFGGSDVLEVYNVQQIKNRLNSTNMFIACTKPNGFSVTITQTGASDQVMAGVRVNLGVCDPARSPTAIVIFGRTITVPSLNRHRWFDIPFTRQEMKKLLDKNTFSIRFASSSDQAQVTIVDSIRVYGRPRDSLVAQNNDETLTTSTNATSTAAIASNGSGGVSSATGLASGSSSNVDESLEDLRRKLIASMPKKRSTQSPLSLKSQIQKLRLMLYAPSITDDEYVMSLDSRRKTVFVCNRMMANSLDALEALISFTKSLAELSIDHHQPPQATSTPPRWSMLLVISAREMISGNEFKLKCDTALLIASKMLTVSLSRRLDRSICMLIAKLQTNKFLYDEHRVEIIFENAIESLKQEAYDNVNVFGHNVQLFKETVHEHPKLFIRLIGKYFTQCNDVYTSTIHFCNYLVDLFWRLDSQRPANELLCPLVKVGQYSNFETIVDSLVYILFSSTHAVLLQASHQQDQSVVQSENQKRIIDRASQLVVQMLCSPDLQISFSTKRALLKILYSLSNGVYRHMEKQTKTIQSSSGHQSAHKQNSSSSLSSKVGHRKSSTKSLDSMASSSSGAAVTRSPIYLSTSGSSSSHQPSDSQHQALSNVASEPSTSAGGSGASAAGILRRQGASRRQRSSGANQSWLTRQDSIHQAPPSAQPRQRASGGAGASSGNSGLFQSSANRTAASLLERVTETLIDTDFDPYNSLILNINSDFPYFQDLITNLRREPELDEVYESVPDDDDDDDDDEDDDDEDDEDDDDDDDDEDDDDDDEDEVDVLDLNLISQPADQNSLAGSGSSNVPAPLFALNSFPEADDRNLAAIAEPAALEEVINEDVLEDDDDDEHDEDEDDDFEAMDEDEMMEMAIALSLQEQARGDPRSIEEMIEFVADETDADRQQQQQQQVERAIEEIVEDYRSQRQRDELDRIVEQENASQQQQQPEAQRQSSLSSSHDLAGTSASVQPPNISSSHRYSTLHSESEDDDEELFEEEKLADTTMESIEAEEEHCDDDDYGELDSMETSQTPGHGSKTSKMMFKSNETIASKSNVGSTASSDIITSTDYPVPTATFTSGGKNSQSKDAQKNRKRQRKLIASKFCLALLKQMLNSYETLVSGKLTGVQAIPYLQVLTILNDFNYSECDQKEFATCYNQIMMKMFDHLLMIKQSADPVDGEAKTPSESPIDQGSTKYLKKVLYSPYKDRIERRPENEVQLLTMRLFSVWLAYFKRFPTITWQTFLTKDLSISEKLRSLIKQYVDNNKSTGTTKAMVTFDQESMKNVGGETASTMSTGTLHGSSPPLAPVVSTQIAKSSSDSTAVVPPTIHPSLLLFASQMIEMNAQILDYCFTLLYHLLKQHWRQLSTVEPDEYEKNKPGSGKSDQVISYYSKKSINIRSQANYIPVDLRPFFTILPETPLPQSSSSVGTSQQQQQQQSTQQTDTAGQANSTGVVVMNNVTNTSSNLSHTCTAINSAVFFNNVFDLYPELLTEIALRIPYQLKKLITFLNGQSSLSQQQHGGNKKDADKDDGMFVDVGETATSVKSSSPIHIEFGVHWIETLCEYMTLPGVTPYIRKQVRKLLSNLCGSKERYRQVRDYYAIKTNLRAVREIIVMHFFDSSSTPSSSSSFNNLAFKLQDVGLSEEDLGEEEQLDELIRIIIGTVVQNDDKNSNMMMMSSDQHRLLNLPYAQLINLVDYLKDCLDIASTRVQNWQRLCRREVRIVPFLFRISFLFGEGISSIILQLLSLALFSSDARQASSSSKKPPQNNLTQNLLITTGDGGRSKESKPTTSKTAQDKTASIASSSNNPQSFICCYVFMVLDQQLMSHFIRFFLLESNSSQQRWATHSLLYMFFESLQSGQQEQFLSLFWQLWPDIACYGKRASQFVDLLGYFTLTISKNNPETNAAATKQERLIADSAVGLLSYQNQVLIKHPNANIYNSLQSLLELNGYYLETEPCLVCNNPEINFFPMKLSAIKMDSRFTTNTQIVKLIGAHTISKITVKISELKKTKMVKTLCIYYNNRHVQSVVELKNKNTVWHKAKRITLAPSQSDVKIEFALPIVACNLMIEYANFYETSHSSTETLQCPRCSSVVLANPGVCTNCGENVFQCHKCRAINYDEKDPYLCNSCGFCKYAKFDIVLTARYTASAVEAIENEEDRAKAVQTINTLLEKADRLYKIILSIRPTLEYLLLASQDYQITMYNGDGSLDAFNGVTSVANNAVTSGSSSFVTASALLGSGQSATSGTANSSATAAGATGGSGGGGSSSSATSASPSSLHINRYIQKLASKYGIDCKQHFEDLSKIVQKILYTRKELVDYDNRQTENRHNFEDIKRLLQEYRQDFMKTTYGGDSTTSLSSSTSSSTLVDSGVATTGASASAIRKHLKQVLVGDEHYHGVETKKMKKLSPEDEDGASAAMIGSTMTAKFDFKSGRCYGCASATIEHCIVLLRALVHNPRYKNILGSSNLFRELIDYNLRIGMISFRNKVRQLLCLLIRDDFETTEEFNNLLLEKIGSVLNARYMTSFDFGFIRHEMSLLASSFENEDNCWEQRLRCVMKLFLLSLQNKSPAVLEAITLPCLRILYGLIIKPTIDQAKAMDHTKSSLATETSTSAGKRQQHQSNSIVEQLASVQTPPLHTLDRSITKIPFESVMVNVSVDLNQWLSGDAKSSFSAWQQRNIKVPPRTSDYTSDPVKLVQLEEYLQRKYFSRWLYLYQNGQIRKLKSECFILRIASSMWIQEVLFNPTSKALRSACRQLLMALFERLTSKQRVLIDLFTSFLDDLCRVGGEVGLDFYDLYRSIVFSEFSASAKTSNVIKNCHWRYYLTLCGLLPHLGHLISAEIERLKQLEESTLSSDFSQGSALRQLVELMQLFMRDERIRRVHKSSMVGFVLDGYLSLRKLIIQRTKMIDETQAALLELLELLTTGTRNETINFMKVCIESVKKCSLQDLRTPVFIFERLCSIIHPEEKDADEFFISLEKDPQQEDFLQGRMLGNPYSSKDSGMGPLMRDIKNKICQECELVSLLEDDSGLELLVNNKIISLDLPVKAVYKKIVCAETSASTSGGSGQASSSAGSVGQAIFASNNAWASGNLNLVQDVAILDAITNTIVFPLGSVLNAQNTNSANLPGSSSSLRLIGPTMKIVYRIRGLMGDATEEFIESLSNKESIVKDDEKLFDLANIMCESNGLSVMLERMQAIHEIDNRSRNLLFVLLKLFGFCVRVAANRRALIQPELNAIGVMIRIVHLFLKNSQTELLTATSAPGEPSYFEQLLTIIETILAEASKEEPDVYDRLNRVAFGTAEDVQLLIDAVSTPKSIVFNSGIPSLTNRFLRVVTFLSIGHSEKMTTLVSNFRPYFDFDLYDNDNQNDYPEMYPLPNPDHWYELFCSLVSAIERNHNGARLKNRMIEEGFVMMAIDYLVRNAPPMKNFVLLNSEEWKEFISRPALEYVLKMLTGMSRGHEPTQMLIVEEEGVPIIHALEQVLSDSHMATLAENLMDALKENPSVEAKIEEIRLKTKEEKKRIAMAVREKQLGELGMKANDKGQVMADSELLKKMEGELKEEKGLVCSICREGYAYQPQKVLAIYTFTKRCNVEEWEDRKPRKTMGYTTVTHFNIVHVECHMDAVRHARTRDEWQSASLHNANTRCNGLLPLWGPSVYESLFAHALSRHNSYLQDAVGQRDFLGTNSFLGTVHDLKLLLLRFAQEKTFSEETGGGGAQSNLYLTPYLMHTALYVMNTTKVADKERQSFDENFVQQSIPKFIESCFQVDGAYFYSTMVLLLHPNSFWKMCRFVFLRRLILCSIVRNLPADSRNVEGVCNAQVTYEIIKPSLMFFAMINLFYTIMFKNVAINPDEDWSQILVEYIRHNDQTLLESADKMLETFENDILPCGSFSEFCDACDLMRGEDAIQNPEQFLLDVQNLTQLS